MADTKQEILALKDKVQNILTCPICLDRFSNPKTLKCAHSFCFECLANLKNKKNCPVCRSDILEIDVDKMKCDVTVRKLMDNTNSGVTQLPMEVGSLVEKFESLMSKRSGKNKIVKAKRKSVKFDDKLDFEPENEPKQAKLKPKLKILPKSEPKSNPKSSQKSEQKTQPVIKNQPKTMRKPNTESKSAKPKSSLNPKTVNKLKPKIQTKNQAKLKAQAKLDKKEQTKLYKGELTPGSSSDDESDCESETGTASSDESGASGESDTETGSESGSGTDSESSTEEEDSSSSDVEHSTMTSEEEDTEADIKRLEKNFKTGMKVAVFPSKDSYRKKHVFGVIRHVTTVKGVNNKVFGVHLTDSTSRGLGEKINAKHLEKKCQTWYAKERESRIWITAEKICIPGLMKDFKN